VSELYYFFLPNAYISFSWYFLSDHFDHIKKIAGSQSIGIGGDYDGVERLVKLYIH